MGLVVPLLTVAVKIVGVPEHTAGAVAVIPLGTGCTVIVTALDVPVQPLLLATPTV